MREKIGDDPVMAYGNAAEVLQLGEEPLEVADEPNSTMASWFSFRRKPSVVALSTEWIDVVVAQFVLVSYN